MANCDKYVDVNMGECNHNNLNTFLKKYAGAFYINDIVPNVYSYLCALYSNSIRAEQLSSFMYNITPDTISIKSDVFDYNFLEYTDSDFHYKFQYTNDCKLKDIYSKIKIDDIINEKSKIFNIFIQCINNDKCDNIVTASDKVNSTISGMIPKNISYRIYNDKETIINLMMNENNCTLRHKYMHKTERKVYEIYYGVNNNNNNDRLYIVLHYTLLKDSINYFDKDNMAINYFIIKNSVIYFITKLKLKNNIAESFYNLFAQVTNTTNSNFGLTNDNIIKLGGNEFFHSHIVITENKEFILVNHMKNEETMIEGDLDKYSKCFLNEKLNFDYNDKQYSLYNQESTMTNEAKKLHNSFVHITKTSAKLYNYKDLDILKKFNFIKTSGFTDSFFGEKVGALNFDDNFGIWYAYENSPCRESAHENIVSLDYPYTMGDNDALKNMINSDKYSDIKINNGDIEFNYEGNILNTSEELEENSIYNISYINQLENFNVEVILIKNNQTWAFEFY